MFDTLRWPDGKLLTYKLVVAVDRKFVAYDVIILYQVFCSFTIGAIFKRLNSDTITVLIPICLNTVSRYSLSVITDCHLRHAASCTYCTPLPRQNIVSYLRYTPIISEWSGSGTNTRLRTWLPST